MAVAFPPPGGRGAFPTFSGGPAVAGAGRGRPGSPSCEADLASLPGVPRRGIAGKHPNAGQRKMVLADARSFVDGRSDG